MEYMSHKKSFIMLDEQNRNFALDKQKQIRGYIKLETGGNRGSLRVGAENLRCFERGSYVYKLILFGKKHEKTIYKIVGNLMISSRGRGETYLRINPADVDGNGNSLDYFTIAIIVAVSATDNREPLHPILRGMLEAKIEAAGKKKPESYNNYYNHYVLQCCEAIEHKKELYDRLIPFKEDRTGADWRRIVNLGKFPLVSPGAQYTMSRYRHFIFGLSEDYYFVGVPGRYLENEQPDGGNSGFVLWQPIMGAECYCADAEGASLKNRQVAYGYWIAAVNRSNGSIEQFGK